MGFLDKLKEVGFGNTGPYGRMDSGATNYAQYARERGDFERERGVTQALAMAAKSGAEIPFNVQAEIAEKWGVPLNAVIQRAKGINDTVFATNAKNKLQTAAQIYMKDKQVNPNLVVDEKYIMKVFEKAGIQDPRIMGMAKDAIVKLTDERKLVSLGQGDKLFSVGASNEAKVVAENKAPVDTSPKNLTESQLTQMALNGDKNAQRILDSMEDRKIKSAAAQAKGKIEGLFENIDIDETAKAVIEGRETIENVKNTFGVPIQEAVRKKVLTTDPSFNFLLPRSVVKSLDTSLKNQEKQRGMMGSFVRNLDKQLDRVTKIGNEVSRLGVRAFDLPRRELITRLKGSGKEKILEGYLNEISNEIGKLSTGSSASIRELSTDAQERWTRIHDPNLSFNELKIILEETRHMAEMRISSSQEEIEFTKERLKNVKSGGSSALQRSTPQTEAPPSKFEIIEVQE